MEERGVSGMAGVPGEGAGRPAVPRRKRRQPIVVAPVSNETPPESTITIPTQHSGGRGYLIRFYAVLVLGAALLFPYRRLALVALVGLILVALLQKRRANRAGS